MSETAEERVTRIMRESFALVRAMLAREAANAPTDDIWNIRFR